MAATCSKCHAPITWIETPNGKWMPCDEGLVEYHADMCGKDLVVADDGRVIRCSFDFKGPATGLARIPHWKTCPFADDFRKRKEKNHG